MLWGGGRGRGLVVVGRCLVKLAAFVGVWRVLSAFWDSGVA